MKKEFIGVAVVSLGSVLDRVITSAAICGGTYIVFDAIGKRYNPKILKQAASLAFERDLKEGDIQEIIRYDYGIPFLVKKFYTDVAMYSVVKIENDGKYKMRYVGSRMLTKEEAEQNLSILK